MSFLAVLAILGGAAYVGREWVRAAVARVQDELLDGNILAQDMTAFTAAPNRGAKLAIDRNTGNSWAADVTGNTSDQYLEAWFEKPFRLSYIFINGGASDDPEAFAKERWPIKVDVVVSGSDGESIAGPFELDDVASEQNFYVGLDVVNSVKLRILESKGPPEARVAVAEVKFLGR